MDINSTGMNQASVAPLQSHSSNHNTGLKPANAITAPPEAKQKQEEGPAVRQEDLQASVDAMNDFVQPLNNSLQFSIDEDTGKTVVKVVDLTTKEVIKQMPTEEALAIAKALDKLKGLLIQQQA